MDSSKDVNVDTTTPINQRSSRFNKLRSRSGTISKSLSPPPQLRRSLSPLTTQIMKPINLATSYSIPLLRSVKSFSDSLTQDSEESEDVAQPPKLMAKSFVSLLTTASMYNGNLQDLIDEEDNVTLNGDKVDGTEEKVINDDDNNNNNRHNDRNSQDEEKDHGINTLDDDKESIESIDSNDDDDDDDDLKTIPEIPEIIQSKAPKIQRTPTLFEFSIEKKFSKDSIQSINNSNQSKEDSKNRALALSSKLKKSFGIDETDEFIADYQCWLLKDVLLQGHLYLTNSHLLFFAFLPKQDKTNVASSGALSIESTNYLTTAVPTKVLNRYWAVLQGNTLSLHNKSTELYFPILTIDLRYALRAEIITTDDDENSNVKTWFKVLTETRTYKFRADSSHAARSWVGVLKKQIFVSKNKNDCVTIKIPLRNVLDLDPTSIFDAAETLQVKVLESPEMYSIDDYFFMFFNVGNLAYKDIQNAVKELSDKNSGIESVLDSTAKFNLENNLNDQSKSNPLKSVLDGSKSPSSKSDEDNDNNDNRYNNSNNNEIYDNDNDNNVPQESNDSAEFGSVGEIHEPVVERHIIANDANNDNDDENYHEHEYATLEPTTLPIESKPTSLIQNIDPIGEEYADKTVVLKSPKNIKGTIATATSYIPGYNMTAKSISQARSSLSKFTPKVLKLWNSNPVHYSEDTSIERGIDDPFLASKDDSEKTTKRFQERFFLTESEKLISTYYAYIQKNVPVYGKIYIGSNEICFRSLVPGIGTKMILPFKDIETCYKEKGFKFGYCGLVLVIHGHEELFFEFNSQVSRDDCEFLLLKHLDRHHSQPTQPSLPQIELSSSKKLEEAKIRLFEEKLHNDVGLDIPIIIEDHPLFKTSIKPDKSYKFTLLTIGSRGDVQPYIALGKGLIKQGHKVTIATHKEFGEWIIKSGLEFKEIAGNPTELMSLMVTHGSMNIGLIKEASAKFRDWIGELLYSSWDACQDTEILIESPSAMAGIHIAEALGIPYFRAFTMPWTRTRAYPHAFIVPDQKKGGSYNYLTHVLFENIFWKGISGQVNEWRKNKLGLPKTNLDLLQQNKVPFLYNVSPSVVPPPVDYNDWVKVTGYWFLDEGAVYEPNIELTEFMQKARNDGKKIVYIGFGSIVVSNPKELTQAVIDAVLDADVRCILNKGWSERLGGSNTVEVPLPPEIYNSGAIPHDWLFPLIDAAVHHGGSGSTGATLRAGLPTIIKPFFGDQFFYANRVEDIGAGISLKKLNVNTLSKALKAATTNQRIITKARQIGEKIRAENGVIEAIDIIYRELEYARGLMLNKRKNNVTIKDERPLVLNDINDEFEEMTKQLKFDKDDLIGEDGSWLLV
ncbi:hypothetical protein WICMUC_000417 [Wickerhamomyces mucosus]|uniref:Sterol 3-beta-glucosyltransferase n=1 Tax=Wickerhamomyces mucosus TaxID=1378264 RepID=A0A9P8TIN3_9ASCO|nr:hypothetical protein WICMUC_000417 [Wickerhamomyces mucosus]